ncbi:MAG: hypothetical protein DMG49_02375 [Acidobacteria bacterium]|nr:MAG: hypothetical protein DMG49_02375 [Acidobacteriota bacterium]
MKTYRVTILSRQLPSAHAEYSYKVEGTKVHIAVSRALKLFEREPHVKGKRLIGVEIMATCVSTFVAASESALLNELRR